MLLDDREERYDAGQLVSFFRDFGWDLTSDFLEAFRSSLDYPSTRAPMLARAALLGRRPPFAEVLAAGLAELDRARNFIDAMDGQLRSADQGELDGEESRYVYDQPTELLYPAQEVLKAVVRLRRRREGYRWIAQDARVADLLEPWAEAISADGAGGDPPAGRWVWLRPFVGMWHRLARLCSGNSRVAEEVRSLLAVCPTSDRPLAWGVVARLRAAEFTPQLLEGLADATEVELPDVLLALSAVVPRADWPARVDPVVAGQPLCRRAQVVSALKHHSLEPLDPPLSDDLFPHLLRPEERSALEACSRWEGWGSVGEIVSRFGEPEKAALRALVASPDEERGVKAGLVLHELGEDVSSSLDRWAGSAATTVRFYTWHLAAAIGSAQALALLSQKGVSDADYQCRRVALSYLASAGTAADWAIVLRAAGDPSGPVRECCAKLIGQHRHQAGESTLVALLADKRDRSEDHHLTIYGGPDRHVARTAAVALGHLNLSPEATEKLVAFVRGGDASCPDWVVHYHVVNCLAWACIPALLPLFVELLADDRHLAGPSRAGFPIRYAAAWGVANALGKEPARADSADLRRLRAGAAHPDPRLAGPCLVALGFIDPRAREALRDAVHGHTDATDRRDLYVLAAAVTSAVKSEDHPELARSSHPVMEITKHLTSEKKPVSEADWRKWIEQHPDVRGWLEG